MEKYGDWEILKRLGGGGQSDVYLVRNPARAAERQECLREIRTALDGDKRAELATAVWTYARPDSNDELGALKLYKIPPKGSTLPPPPDSEEFEAIHRLKNEVTALRENRFGLPRFLDSNEDERWIVTELFPEGSLERHILKYQGNVAGALRAYRSLVATVALLHESRYVHRDIKPANVFLRKDDGVVLGDFGIVFMPSGAERITTTKERVGPRDYMPLWGDLGERLERVHANFDVYMLGKLLWCMIAGHLKLPRECHKWPEFDLVTRFPDDRNMHLINSILDKCVVERPENCLLSAKQLLEVVEESISVIDHGVPLRDGTGKLVIPCRICGKGFYHDEGSEVRLPAFDAKNMPLNTIHLRLFVCNVCTHREFFAPGHPHEAADKSWTPWSSPKPNS